MVISRLTIIILALGIFASGGVSVWLVGSAAQENGKVESLSTGSKAASDRQARAKEFFGEKREYDMKGGQEMRPRW